MWAFNTYFTLFTKRHVKVEQIFMDFPLLKRFSEKYELIELVLNFAENSILVKEIYFHPILVELEHRDQAKSCI